MARSRVTHQMGGVAQCLLLSLGPVKQLQLIFAIELFPNRQSRLIINLALIVSFENSLIFDIPHLLCSFSL